MTTVSTASRAGSPVDPALAAIAGEAELIRATLAGDTQAFGEIVHTHNSRVYNFLYQMTRNRHDAEDLAQQTFIRAYRNLGGFDPRRPLINWLLTIARNSALNHFRDTKKWSEIPVDAAAPGPSPAHAAESSDRATNLWDHARAVLSAREFEVMWLRFAEDFSTEETARILGLTQTHIKVIVFRARKALGKGEA
jgi:RNA polymerase sigma-70 factor (ECF subfamily)